MKILEFWIFEYDTFLVIKPKFDHAEFWFWFWFSQINTRLSVDFPAGKIIIKYVA